MLSSAIQAPIDFKCSSFDGVVSLAKFPTPVALRIERGLSFSLSPSEEHQLSSWIENWITHGRIVPGVRSDKRTVRWLESGKPIVYEQAQHADGNYSITFRKGPYTPFEEVHALATDTLLAHGAERIMVGFDLLSKLDKEDRDAMELMIRGWNAGAPLHLGAGGLQVCALPSNLCATYGMRDQTLYFAGPGDPY